MIVEQIMIAPVTTVDPSMPVGKALELLNGRRFRHLPVVSNGALLGIVSDRDLQVALARSEAGDDPEPTVGRIMHRGVVTVSPVTSIEEASRELIDHRIGALPVMADGRLVGIVTQTDLLQLLIQMLSLIEPRDRLELELRARSSFRAGAVDAFGEGWPVSIAPSFLFVGRD